MKFEFSKKIIIAGSVVLAVFLLGGCEESTEVARAQQCLDKIDDTDGTNLAANSQACIDIVASVDSAGADVIRCSGYFLKGGLTTSRIVESATAMSAGGSNNEAKMIGALALSDKSVAQLANTYCAKTGIDGLAYLGSLALMGTTLNSISGAWPAGTTPDASQIAAALNTCKSGGCDDAIIGSSIVTLGDSYCAGSQKNSDVCIQLNQAIVSGNGNNALIAQQFWTLLEQN